MTGLVILIHWGVVFLGWFAFTHFARNTIGSGAVSGLHCHESVQRGAVNQA